MLTTLLASAAILGAAPTPGKIVSASLFKNGYAVIIREVPLNPSGETYVEPIPRAVLGTLWIAGSKGVKFKEIVSTKLETETETPAADLNAALDLNIGKTLNFQIQNQSVSGKLLASQPSLVVIEDASGIRMYPKGLIQYFSGDGSVIWKRAVKEQTPVYRVQAEAPAGGKMYLTSLEYGLTWSPAYNVDISDEKNAEVSAKAVVINEIGDLSNADVRLVAGFPNIPMLGSADPFSVVGEIVASASPSAPPGVNMTNQSFRSGESYGGGRQYADMQEAFDVNRGQDFGKEDLFFYALPKTSLKKGERGYFYLAVTSSPYKHLYEWTIPDQVLNDTYRPSNAPGTFDDVWHSLSFVNQAKMPLTTGPAITTSGGQILGQDMLDYTGPGRSGKIRITKSPEVLAESMEEEIQRTQKMVQVNNSHITYDEITLKGTLRVKNLKKEAVEMLITKTLSGEMISSEGSPKITTIAKGLRSVNPRQELVWNQTVPSGDTRVLHYTYKVLLRN